ncbi:zinc finger protein 846-like [Hippocampus zosterae]|uniref:zinc finger protein 846-like n=1 Tax=Hippocampus zosterae TaxID=109293 RepID=UPI00223D820A|nr:zinc finger protein 846-like [Hippocampus zosterae]
MCKVRILRALVVRRLTEAADEIFGLFERTITEYEEELCRSKEENERQRQLLDAFLRPSVQLQLEDVEQPTGMKEEFGSEQHEWQGNAGEQKTLEPCHIKVEDHWSNLEGENGNRTGDEVRSSHLHYRQSHDTKEPALLTSSLTAETAEDHSEASKPHIPSDLGADRMTSDSLDESLHRNVDSLGNRKKFQCGDCGKTYMSRASLKRHTMSHTGERPHRCSICGKNFTQRSDLVMHLRSHTGLKPFACTLCCWKFAKKSSLVLHMRRHTGEKPHWCSVCGKRFRHRSSLVEHSRVHIQGSVYSCSVCGAGFTGKRGLVAHRKTHSTEQALSCTLCGKKVSNASYLALHMRIHTGEKTHLEESHRLDEDQSKVRTTSMMSQPEKYI